MACSGAGETVAPLGPTGLNRAAGGSSLDTQLPAPAFDPQGETKYVFREESFHSLVAGLVTISPGASNFEIKGQIFSTDTSAPGAEKNSEVPCCEGRWVALREGKDSVCRLFQVKSAGELALIAGSLPSREDPFPLAIAKADFQVPAEKELRPCPPVFDGVTPGEFSFFPVAYSSDRFNDTGPAEFLSSDTPPANNGIQSLNFSPQLPGKPSIQLNFNLGKTPDAEEEPLFEAK